MTFGDKRFNQKNGDGVLLYAVDTDGNPRLMQCDLWGNLSVVPHEHYRIHNGQAYFTGALWGEINSPVNPVADNAAVEILVQAKTGMHSIFDISASGDCEIQRFKSVTFSDAGDVMASFNKNEYSTNTTSSIISCAPTVSDYGTELPPIFLPGGTGGNAGGGQDGGYSRELVMKTGVDYLVRITNRKGQSSSISFNMEWYETE